MPKHEKPPSPAELARREDAFRIYRDLGPQRSYTQLQTALKPKHGEITVRTFSNWAKAHSWRERLAAHDALLQRANAVQVEVLDQNFDKRKALLEAAHLALMRALQSVPVVVKPQDFKSLVDAAANAVRLVEKLDELRGAGGSEQVGAAKKRMFVVLDAIEQRIRDAGKNAKLIEGEAVNVVADVEVAARGVAGVGAGADVGAQQADTETQPATAEDEAEQPQQPAAQMSMAERLAARRRVDSAT